MTSEILDAVPPVTSVSPLRPQEKAGAQKKDESHQSKSAPTITPAGQPVGQRQEPVPRKEGTGPPDQPSMQEVAEAIGKHLAEVQERGYLRELRFDYEHVEEGVFQLKVLDARTDKVLRTIPSEEQIEFAKKLERFLGLLIDEQV